jgi:hypothetical protein
MAYDDGSKPRRIRIRLWAQSVSAAVSLAVAALTALVPDWLEAVTGVDPDQRGGAVEWAVAAGFATAAALLGLRALRLGLSARRLTRARRAAS